MEERLQKLMAQAGIASRRQAEELITQGLVTVNGRAAHLGDKADPAKDDIRFDGSRLRLNNERVYVMLNKPMGVVTAVTAQEQEKRPTVRAMIPLEGHLYPVGRLDADSEGLVLMTSDGDLAQKLTHPRYDHPKIYDVALHGKITDSAITIWERGVVLEEDGPTRPVTIKVLLRDKDISWIRITMREGKKRQIRRIAKMLGFPVKQLVRTQIGTLSLGTLKSGDGRHLTEAEVAMLLSSVKDDEQKPTRRYRPYRRPGPGIKQTENRRSGSGNKQTENEKKTDSSRRRNQGRTSGQRRG